MTPAAVSVKKVRMAIFRRRTTRATCRSCSSIFRFAEFKELSPVVEEAAPEDLIEAFRLSNLLIVVLLEDDFLCLGFSVCTMVEINSEQPPPNFLFSNRNSKQVCIKRCLCWISVSVVYEVVVVPIHSHPKNGTLFSFD